MSRMNQWFVLGDGIAREVITADIQRYLGPDALVRPGVGTAEYEGRPGYWITAYRTLTSQMIQDLKLDSQRWQAEKDREHGRGGGVAYQDSRTHASRQHYGPSESYAQPAKQPAYTPAGYGTQETHYTTAAPTTGYTTQHQGYAQPPPSHHPTAEPRTTYTNYPQPTGGRADYPSYATTQQYATYTQQPAQQPTDPYGRPTQTNQYSAAPSAPVAAPGYYIASDGRQYPLSQQPQQQQQQQQQQRRRQ